jgi:hypothetical protein
MQRFVITSFEKVHFKFRWVDIVFGNQQMELVRALDQVIALLIRSSAFDQVVSLGEASCRMSMPMKTVACRF